MTTIEQRITAFSRLGSYLNSQLQNINTNSKLDAMLLHANAQNNWFTIANQVKALKALATMLQKDDLTKWITPYALAQQNKSPKTIGVIMAGNIPAVGFHDILVVLMSGNNLLAKNSSQDGVLMKYLSDTLVEIEPAFKNNILYTDKIKDVDAVIATGSNNSARYFEYYFKSIPHIIRKNRNSTAILAGNESPAELNKLGVDIFSYFGLGCRNVSKLMVPDGYDFTMFFESIASFDNEMTAHNKYLNNYDYYRAIYLMEQIPFLTNNFLHVKEDKSFSSPVSVLHYEYYNSRQNLKDILAANLELIQCIVSNEEILGGEIAFGKTQQPAVNDYADGVDTMEFVAGL